MQGILSCIKKQLLWVGILFGATLTVSALESRTPYSIEVAVVDNQEFNQEKLLAEAFQNLLVQLSGSDKVVNLPAIQVALKEPDHYITQFSYHQRPTQERYIKVVFNETRINQLFGRIKQPIWESKRPLTMLWILVERNRKFGWLGGDEETELTQEMVKALKGRDIPFVLPLLDLRDTTQVTEQEILNETIEPIQQAAKRYQAHTILVGRLFEKEGSWHGRWILVNNQVKNGWDTQEKDLTALLKRGAEDLATKLTENTASIALQAPSLKKEETFSLMVTGIKSFQKYNQIYEYLQTLPGIITVEVSEIMPERTLFYLRSKISKEAIHRTISQGPVLLPTNVAENLSQEALSYQVAGG